MINVSSAWHRTLYNDNRNYLERITVTLVDNTVINLTNENIWGGAKFDDAVSSDNDFQIGSAIVNKLVFNINNIYEDYSEYDFTGAKVVAKLGLVTDEGTKIIKKGTYTVNTATYNGSLINIECYDNMSKFEKQYSESTLVYPATLDTIVRGACTDCGVQLQTLNFPHKTYVIQERPSDENCTYREIISWCAQVAGCFARCNTDGKLEIKWFDQASIGDGSYGLNGGIFDDGSPRYASGDTADGGNFNPWNTGYEHDSGEFSTPIKVHYISSLYSKNISVDDVVITGVKVLIKGDGNNAIEPILVGTSGYVIEISNNPFISSTAIATEIATWLGTQLIGFKFRKAQITHGSDPSIEAGDVALVIDGKGRIYPIVISHTVFTVGSAQTTTSSAQTPARNSAQRFSNETKNYIELRKAIKNEHTAREEAELELAQAIANAGGLYETTMVDSETGATTYYLHNKTVLNESDIRLMFSDVGITVTADSGQHWYGLTASGDMIAHLLSATGINADWINTGQLVIKDAQNREVLFADADSGVVRIAPTQFTLTSANITTIQNQATGIANTAKQEAISTASSDATSKANAAEQNAKDYSDTQLSAYQSAVARIVNGLQDQIDGQIMSWYYDYEPTLNNVPASDWNTSDLKKEHEGDIFYWKSKGYAYRFMNDGTEANPDWKWVPIQDTDISTAIGLAQDARDTADSKRRIFTAQPTDADEYDAGDLWVNATYGTTYTNDILKCKTPKASGALFAISHWERASKYTDDTALNAFKNGDFATFMTSTNNKLDAKITTFYQASDPTANVVGDLWIDTDDHNKLYRWNGTTWQDVRDTDIQAALTAAGDAQSTADSKIITFAQASQPTATDIGDLWIDTDDNNKLYRWNGSAWSPMTDTSGLQSWITDTYTSDMDDLQSQIDKKIETWRQATDPSLSWTDTSTKDKHVKDLWYCVSTEDVIPSWLLPYVGKESGMTALLSQRADDTWFSITNDVNFSIDGATSTNIYIDSNSTIAFANSQPSTSGRNQAYNLNICRRDGQAVSIKHQTITSGSNKAVKIKFSGYTGYSQSDQTPEYANEYEVFFTNSNEVYINVLKQPTNTSYLGDTSIKDNGTTVTFSLSAGSHASIKKVSDAWVATVDKYTNNTSWIYTKTGNVYSWEKLDSGIPSELLDEIDGKAQIFTTSSTPTGASEGDLWFKSATDPIKTYVNGQWVEYNKYTDDSTANANLVTAKSYSDTNLHTAKNYADSAVSTYNTNLDQQAVFNKLTNNGQTQGIFLENNRIYINMTYASTGTLVVGGSTTDSGVIEIKNNYNNRVGRIDKTGFYFGNIASSLSRPYLKIDDDGVIESHFGGTSYYSSHYAKMGATCGLEVQGKYINTKIYASDWTYETTDDYDPDAEVPDLGPDDSNRMPGFFGLNTGIKITDTNTVGNYRKSYTAVGKNYVEICYNGQTNYYKNFAQLRSTASYQALVLARQANNIGYEQSVLLTEYGFTNIVDRNNYYKGYNGTLTIGNSTYHVVGGIICVDH